MDTNNRLSNYGKRQAPGEDVAPAEKPLTIEELCRLQTQRALDIVIEIMEDPTAQKRSRLDAALAILDRGHGKPTIKHEQAVVITLQDTLKQIALKEQRYQEVIADVEVIEEAPDAVLIDWGDSV